MVIVSWLDPGQCDVLVLERATHMSCWTLNWFCFYFWWFQGLMHKEKLLQNYFRSPQLARQGTPESSKVYGANLQSRGHTTPLFGGWPARVQSCSRIAKFWLISVCRQEHWDILQSRGSHITNIMPKQSTGDVSRSASSVLLCKHSWVSRGDKVIGTPNTPTPTRGGNTKIQLEASKKMSFPPTQVPRPHRTPWKSMDTRLRTTLLGQDDEEQR